MYLVVFILATLSIAQSVDVIFEQDVVTYNVQEGESVSYICKHKLGELIDVLESNHVVLHKSKVIDNRFTYSNVIEGDIVTHNVTLNSINRSLNGSTYICTGRNLALSLHMSVLYRPNSPICVTNYYKKPSEEGAIFQCVSENANPQVEVDISVAPVFKPTHRAGDISNFYDTQKYELNNGTHMMRMYILADKHVEQYAFICVVKQNGEQLTGTEWFFKRPAYGRNMDYFGNPIHSVVTYELTKLFVKKQCNN